MFFREKRLRKIRMQNEAYRKREAKFAEYRSQRAKFTITFKLVTGDVVTFDHVSEGYARLHEDGKAFCGSAVSVAEAERGGMTRAIEDGENFGITSPDGVIYQTRHVVSAHFGEVASCE